MLSIRRHPSSEEGELKSKSWWSKKLTEIWVMNAVTWVKYSSAIWFVHVNCYKLLILCKVILSEGFRESEEHITFFTIDLTNYQPPGKRSKSVTKNNNTSYTTTLHVPFVLCVEWEESKQQCLGQRTTTPTCTEDCHLLIMCTISMRIIMHFSDWFSPVTKEMELESES